MNHTLSSRFGLYIILSISLVTTLVACQKTDAPIVAQEITAGTSCSLDGMTLADFPGPKAQIHYAVGEPDYFCDTVEMFSIYLKPEQKKTITGIFTQDMGVSDWEKPQGNWIDAKQAFYVLDSKKTGSMGPTIASFLNQQDADNFVKDFGGKVLPFDKVTADMADLSGGVMHDEHM
jgi:copper chaperone NosL